MPALWFETPRHRVSKTHVNALMERLLTMRAPGKRRYAAGLRWVFSRLSR